MIRATNEPTGSPHVPPWTERNQKLATAWLESFAGAVVHRDAKRYAALFHPFAVVFGADEHGPVDGVEALGFRVDVRSAKIAPLDPVYALITVEWRAISPILGGKMRQGWATFVLYVTEPKEGEKGSVECVHAHFSRK